MSLNSRVGPTKRIAHGRCHGRRRERPHHCRRPAGRGTGPRATVEEAHRRGAPAGTIGAGRIADLLVLDADPLADIHNIRKLSIAVKDGRVIELDRLPDHPVFYGREKDTRR